MLQGNKQLTHLIQIILTYCWKSQLSTYYHGINAGEEFVTHCAPLVIVADLYSTLV